MELTQLKYFRSLAYTKSFTKTAKEIAISQSALSRSISKLENDLGTSLFDRHGKETNLTQEGERFLFHVERVLRELETAEQELKTSSESEGIVRISFLHSLGDTYLPLIISKFHKKYPHVIIKLNQLNSANMAVQLQEGETDVCLCSVLDGENIAWMYLWSEELYLVVPEDHSLAGKKTVHLEEIDGESFITLKPEYGLRQQLNQFLEMSNSHPNVIFEGDEVHNLISLVAAHLGVSILPHVPCTEELGVSYIPISFPVCKRTVGIAWNMRQPLSKAAICFQQFTIQYFQEHSVREF